MIEIHNLSVNKGKVDILKDINFEVSKGEVVILLGENGSGKTTIIKSIAGLEDYRGNIYVDGLAVGDGGEDKISFLSQDFYPLGDFRVSDIITLCSNVDEEVLRMLGIDSVYEKRIRELSGGERRRVGISLALMHNKDYVVLDEPTSNIDISYTYKLVKVINAYKGKGKGFLIATHDVIFATEVGDRFVFLREGKVAYITSKNGFFFACTEVFGSNIYTEMLKSGRWLSS